MNQILQQIIAKKKLDLMRYQNFSLQFQQKKRGNRLFFESIRNAKQMAVIAEIKLASPSEKQLGTKELLIERAKMYERAGADAISIITENHFFHGDPSFVSQVKNVVQIPVLQKDFILDKKQIEEASSLGSDALLLIARIISPEQLQEFVSYCFAIGIEPVVEVNSEEDLAHALATEATIIAVNARDLDTFVVDIAKACSLLEKIPADRVRLGFSGVHAPADALHYRQTGAKGVLIGTELMKKQEEQSITAFIQEVKERCK
jgi:indole-3-glycerol phosphate synthase